MCPLYYGDYPAVMRERIGDRLPKFSQEEKELLGNSLDFIGLNHYTSRFIAHVNNGSEESFFYRAQEMERTGNNLSVCACLFVSACACILMFLLIVS